MQSYLQYGFYQKLNIVKLISLEFNYVINLDMFCNCVLAVDINVVGALLFRHKLTRWQQVHTPNQLGHYLSAINLILASIDESRASHKFVHTKTNVPVIKSTYYFYTLPACLSPQNG